MEDFPAQSGNPDWLPGGGVKQAVCEYMGTRLYHSGVAPRVLVADERRGRGGGEPQQVRNQPSL